MRCISHYLPSSKQTQWISRDTETVWKERDEQNCRELIWRQGKWQLDFFSTKSEWVYTPTRVVKEPRVGESPRNTLKKRPASHESNQTNRHILPVDQKARNNNTLKISLLLFLERILFNVCWYCRLCKWKSGRGRDLKLLSYYYSSSRLHIDRTQTANRWHRRVPSSLRYR